MHELLVLLIVLVLCGLLLIKLSLVCLSVMKNSLSNGFEGNVAVNINFLEDSLFLGDLIWVDMLKLLKNLVFVRIGVYYLGNIETLDLVLADLVVASDHNVVHIFASEHH